LYLAAVVSLQDTDLRNPNPMLNPQQSHMGIPNFQNSISKTPNAS
jgi:hypothetical protein